MKNTPWAAPFPKSALSAAVCLGLIVATSNAQAMVLTAEATVTLPLSTSVTETEIDPSYVSVYVGDYGTSGDAYASAWGDDGGDMFARSSGGGSFDADSSIRQSVEFTNTTGIAQNYFFDFTINNGSLSAYDYDVLVSGEYVQAANDVAIMLNGDYIFTSQATLTSTDSGSTLTTSGVELGTYTADSDYYSWGTYTGVLDLGIFNPGESFLLEYDILTSADSNVSSSFGCGYDDGYGSWGNDGWMEEEFGFCYSNYGASRFGDPNGINGMPISPLTVTSVSVPEPGMLFLLAGGVAGLAFAGRKRARKS